ncbi:putative MutT/NUDIX-like protein [Actinorhabdospora filicis]|uniref:MutT/NUDIX-like protein n=1 Tax=Actinorhabdospora filicis TaxID=1785913 RepID=A0A9W6W9L8_9ACTN|nr:NUDIX domain-containing protein [Actinorhabdospora filicis]GLZ78128.1 putative MutT/NUDIX-like protein [Actinorhabdospora filicis]
MTTPRRRDFHNDPNAPAANSLVPAVAVFVRDERDRVLLIRRSDNGRWSLPGGGQELGESIRGAMVREAREETGLDVEVTGLVGVYSDPGHVVAFRDGEVRQEFVIVGRAVAVGGELAPDDDATEAAWFTPAELDGLDVHEAARVRIAHGLAGGAPYVG